MPVNFNSLSTFSKENAFLVMEAVRKFTTEKKISFADICNEAGLQQSESDNRGPYDFFYDFITRKRYRGLDKGGSHKNYKKLVRYLSEREDWDKTEFIRKNLLTGIDLYHPLSMFLNIQSNSEKNTEKRLKTWYQIYRHSVSTPDCFAVGYAKITYDKHAASFHVNEYFYKKIKHGLKEDQFTGHLIRTGDRYYILTRNVERNSLHLCVLRSGDKHKIQIMTGAVIGWGEAKPYTSSIVFEASQEDTEESVKKEVGIYTSLNDQELLDKLKHPILFY